MSLMLLSSPATMANILTIPSMHLLARYLDPRRSLAAAIGWLVFVLSIGLVLVASVWVGDIVRTNLLDQRGRQLDRTADRYRRRTESQSRASTAIACGTLAAMLATELGDDNRATLRKILENLQQAVPEFAWIGVANPQGRVLAATHGVARGRERCRPVVVCAGSEGVENRRCAAGANGGDVAARRKRPCTRALRRPDRLGYRRQGRDGRRHRGATEQALAAGSCRQSWAEGARVCRYRSAAAGPGWHGTGRAREP